jgi:hypothetical protein
VKFRKRAGPCLQVKELLRKYNGAYWREWGACAWVHVRMGGAYWRGVPGSPLMFGMGMGMGSG